MPKSTDAIVAAARACIGTPFHAQGRRAGVGLDCAGLILIAARAAGIVLDDDITYAMPPSPQQLLRAIARSGAVPQALIEPGYVLLFRLGGQPQHMAIATAPGSMVHAYAPAGRVVETNLGPFWHNRLIGIYSLQGH